MTSACAASVASMRRAPRPPAAGPARRCPSARRSDPGPRCRRPSRRAPRRPAGGPAPRDPAAPRSPAPPPRGSSSAPSAQAAFLRLIHCGSCSAVDQRRHRAAADPDQRRGGQLTGVVWLSRPLPPAFAADIADRPASRRRAAERAVRSRRPRRRPAPSDRRPPCARATASLRRQARRPARATGRWSIGGDRERRSARRSACTHVTSSCRVERMRMRVWIGIRIRASASAFGLGFGIRHWDAANGSSCDCRDAGSSSLISAIARIALAADRRVGVLHRLGQRRQRRGVTDFAEGADRRAAGRRRCVSLIAAISASTAAGSRSSASAAAARARTFGSASFNAAATAGVARRSRDFRRAPTSPASAPRRSRP